MIGNCIRNKNRHHKFIKKRKKEVKRWQYIYKIKKEMALRMLQKRKYLKQVLPMGYCWIMRKLNRIR